MKWNSTQLDPSLSYQQLVQLGQALLGLVPLELRPKFKVLVEHFEGLLVVLGQLDLLPKLVGQMGSLDGFHVQVAGAFRFEESGIPGIGQGARVSVAEAR